MGRKIRETIAGIFLMAMVFMMVPQHLYAEELGETSENGLTEDLMGQEDADNPEEQTENILTEEESQIIDNLIVYAGHQQTYGDLAETADGGQLGVTGTAKRLEAVSIKKGGALTEITGNIVYRVHGQTYGTQDWVSDGAEAGSRGQAKRVEAIQIYLTGQLAEEYDIYYRSHIQTYGWLQWVKGENPENQPNNWSGSMGLSKRMESLQIQLVKKGGEAPSDTDASSPYKYITRGLNKNLLYTGHQQTYGDLPDKGDGQELGITGQSRRLEAVSIEKGQNLMNVAGSIVYQVHGQTYGTQNWVADGAEAGSHGQSKRVEAIQIYLTGQLAEKYDIYYRAHIQSYGWLQWVKGVSPEENPNNWSGSMGLSKRMESLQIQLVEKGSEAPSDEDATSPYKYVTKGLGKNILYTGHQQTYGDLPDKGDGQELGVTGQSKRMEAVRIEKGQNLINLSGDIEYQVHGQTYGTQGWVKNGALAGTEGQAKRIEAIRIRLTGQLAEQYDVYYTVHCQKYGWMKWTKGIEGEEEGGWCGTSDLYLQIESLRIKLVKNGEVPSEEENTGSRSYLTRADFGSITYEGTQQDLGGKGPVSDGQTLGTTGVSKAMETFKLTLSNESSDPVAGGVQYRAHVQGDGWQDWADNGTSIGVSGKRLEAVQIFLTGDLASYCDIWYRTHVQGYGWLGWAKNGQTAGTTDIGYRMEAIEVRLVPKSCPEPGVNSGYNKNVPKYTTWASSLNAAKTSSQLIIVSVTSGSYATVSMHTRTGSDWKLNFTVPGRVGYAGIGKTREGDGKTPTGIFSLHTPFGIKSNPGCPLGYTKVNSNHYWGGADAKYYNKLVDASKIPGYRPGNAEHLIDYPGQYNYCVAVGYNEAGVVGKGSAIFLHCSGKGSTAGCISIPEKNMITVLQNLRSDAKIIIDYSTNITRY